MSADTPHAILPSTASRRALLPAVGADLIIPSLSVVVGIYYIASTVDLTWESRSTGWLVGIALLVLCAIQVGLVALRRFRGEVTLGFGGLFADSHNNRRRLGLMGVLAAFVAFIPLTGTTLGLFLAMTCGMLIMGVRRPGQVIGIAACTTASVFLLFIVLLKSRLPRGALDQALVQLLLG